MSKWFDRSNRAGFTLVELIVVIAILAILAGIAVPVYTKYVNKANKAKDYELLSIANSSLAAAFAENRVDYKNLAEKAVVLDVDGDRCIAGIDSIATAGLQQISFANGEIVYGNLAYGGNGAQYAQLGSIDDLVEAIKKSFLKYFGNNIHIALKYAADGDEDHDIIYFEGEFIIAEDKASHTSSSSGSGAAQLLGSTSNGNGTTTYSFKLSNGKEVSYTVSDAAIAYFQNSTFGTNIGVADLMGDVTGMTNALSSALNTGNTLAGLISGAGLNLDDLGITPDEDGNYDPNQLANATVLMVATKTNPDPSALVNTLTSGKSAIQSYLGVSNYGDKLTNMAGLYGIATSFASSDAAAGWTKEVDGKTYTASEYYNYVNEQIAAAASAEGVPMGTKVGNIQRAMAGLTDFMYESDGTTLTSQFAQYADSSSGTSQLEKDANGYVSAMGAIQGNVGSLVETGTIDGGYGDEVISILSQVLGS